MEELKNEIVKELTEEVKKKGKDVNILSTLTGMLATVTNIMHTCKKPCTCSCKEE